MTIRTGARTGTALLAVVLALAGCGGGTTNHAVITLGDTPRFAVAERQAAADAIVAAFKSFRGCDLRALWYDEALTISEYGADDPNGIVFLSEFHVNASGGDGSFNPNQTYTNWQWKLTRAAPGATWTVVDWGQG